MIATLLQQSAFHAGSLRASVPAMLVLEPVVAVFLGEVVLGEHLAVSKPAAVVLTIAVGAMAAATIALGRDEGAYEEELEAAAARDGAASVAARRADVGPRGWLARPWLYVRRDRARHRPGHVGHQRPSWSTPRLASSAWPRCRSIRATPAAAPSNRTPPNCWSRCSPPAGPRSPRPAVPSTLSPCQSGRDGAGLGPRHRQAAVGRDRLAGPAGRGAVHRAPRAPRRDRAAHRVGAGPVLLGAQDGLAAQERRNRGVVTTSDTWLLHRLTGRFVTDATTASRSLLVELGDPGWSRDLLELFGLTGERLPVIVGNDEIIGSTTAFGRDTPLGGGGGSAGRPAGTGLPRPGRPSARWAPAPSCWPTPAPTRSAPPPG